MASLFYPHDGLKRLIASSSAFQTACGVASAAAALPFCVSNGASDFAKARAIVRAASGMRRVYKGIGNATSTGTLYFSLWRKYTEFLSTDTTTYDTAEKTFVDWCSTVITEMEVLIHARGSVMSENPLSVQSISSSGDVDIIPASEWQAYTQSDPTVSSDYKDKAVWALDFEVEVF